MSNRRRLRPGLFEPVAVLVDDLDDDEDYAGDGECLCADCGDPTFSLEVGADVEWYVVHDEVWGAAGGPGPGFLHIRCLEARLGRQLHSGDFPPIPVNDPAVPRSAVAWSQRTQDLQDALGRVPTTNTGTPRRTPMSKPPWDQTRTGGEVTQCRYCHEQIKLIRYTDESDPDVPAVEAQDWVLTADDGTSNAAACQARHGMPAGSDMRHRPHTLEKA